MKHPDFSHIGTHTVRNHRYIIKWRRPPRGPGKKPGQGAGQCDNPRTPKKIMYLHPDKDPMELLGTVVHELFHASCFDIGEVTVIEFERDLLRLLKRMGMKIEFEPKR